jgi:DNA-binding NarL/FixJ family response regulator
LRRRVIPETETGSALGATARILIVDDQALVRAAVRALLEAFDGVDVVGEAADGPSALDLVARYRPDLVVLDVSMPGMSGFETAVRIREQTPGVRILMLSMHRDEEYAHRAANTGVAGYIAKDSAPHVLQAAVAAIASGSVYFDPDPYRHCDPARTKAPLARLTPRQREVLSLVARGYTTTRIAQQLSVSPKTVQAHRAEVMARLRIHDLAGLVRFSIRHGLVDYSLAPPAQKTGTYAV